MPESLSPFVFDASAENFDRLILGNSARGLVLAHFWSPRAGPCMLLMPRLLKLASEFTGRFLLVMVNTDELGRQARDLGVTSVPTVKFFLGGKVAHTIHGAESEDVFRTALRRFLADPREEPRLAALALHQAGDSEAAIAMLARLAVEHPQDLAVATSGDYRHYLEVGGARLAHSMDTRRGAPVRNDVASVTVLARTCMQADAWATALLVAGVGEGLALAQRQALEALWLLRRGDALVEVGTGRFAPASPAP